MYAPQSEERPFDVIPFEDIQGDWKKLGSGSFGNVYKGQYLGIDVAIKEVLPSTEYDVAKYFEREWRLMKECRHPNVVLYIGLSRAPDPDGRVFIISEFIDNGNLRLYIHDKSKPFHWPLRLSFATDIARSLAYLHARKCLHRDLKGENLLVTSNLRLKITDFGFARIAARSREESKRLTFCGTDSYMSPEIMKGDEFDLPTDVYSLGVILVEIACRKLADDNTFKRAAPTYEMDADEVRSRASPGCPPEFLQLALDCLAVEPAARPTMVGVLSRLRNIELEVLERPEGAEPGARGHVGSVKFATGARRPGAAPRIPSFGMGIGQDIRLSDPKEEEHSSDEESDEEQIVEAIKKLDVEVGDRGSNIPLLGKDSAHSDYSTAVVRGHSQQATTVQPSLSSILTIRSPQATETGPPILAEPLPPILAEPLPPTQSVASIASVASFDSFHTASSSLSHISSANATIGGSGSTMRGLPPDADTSNGMDSSASSSAAMHRFTLIKPGASRARSPPSSPFKAHIPLTPLTPQSPQKPASPPKPSLNLQKRSPGSPTRAGRAGGVGNGIAEETVKEEQSWSPFGFFFSSALGAKCDLCGKRLGRKLPSLECDDCGLRVHVVCGEHAPMDCGLRPSRSRTQQSFLPNSPGPSKLSKAKFASPSIR